MKFAHITLVLSLILIAGCSNPSGASPTSCPESCDDNNYCTTDFCSNETSFSCIHSMNYLTPVFEDDMSNGISKWSEVFETNAWNVSDGVLESNFVSEPNSLPPYLFASGINAFKGDYAMTGKFKLEDGVFVITTRITDFKGYSFWLLENMVLLLKVNATGPGIPPTALAFSQSPITKNIWLNFKAITVGDKIMLYVEDRKVIDVTDDDELLSSGSFGFAVSSQAFDNVYDSGAVHVDNVRIYEVNESNYLCIQ